MFKSGPPRRIQPSLQKSEEPPPLPKKARAALPPWLPLAGVAGAAALLGLALVTGLYFLLRGSSYSKNDDELRTPQMLQADYARWSSGLRQITQAALDGNAPAVPVLAPAVPTDPSTLGWWERWRNLPPEGLAKTVLARRLPPQIELTGLTPRRMLQEEDAVSVDYEIRLKAREDIVLAPVVPVAIPPGLSSTHQRLLPRMVYAYDLPPGKVFDLAQAKTVIPAGTTVIGGWTLRRAVRSSGTWMALSADLLPMTRIPALEAIFVKEATTPPPAWLHSQLLHVPGHCPGSLCLYFPKTEQLYGGDVLFADGVGRWDLPGGSQELLLSGIRKKILPLPDSTIVYPGHGSSTTVGREKTSNPFLQI
ncbi:MAG: MBL fold metallo-hydrolase [Verrucomicrobia bacterium]|nr:MBL fold metallo-hydrolase [Verrucomicrobiota bacterium]